MTLCGLKPSMIYLKVIFSRGIYEWKNPPSSDICLSMIFLLSSSLYNLVNFSCNVFGLAVDALR